MTIELLLGDVVASSLRVLVGTTLAWLLGVVLGFFCHHSPVLSKLLLPIVNFIRHISPFCWLPLIILTAGIGEISVGLTLLLAMTFHCVISSLELLRSLPLEIRQQTRLDGETGWRLAREVELPLSLAGLIDIYRILWGVGWSTVIAAEMLGVKSGLGYRLLDFRYLLRYREMLFYIAVIGLIGLGTDILLRALKKRVASMIGVF